MFEQQQIDERIVANAADEVVIWRDRSASETVDELRRRVRLAERGGYTDYRREVIRQLAQLLVGMTS